MIKLIASVGICVLGGFIGSFFTASSAGSWYAALKKPALNPPAWIFAPVWTVLYIMMGVSAFLIWKQGLGNDNVKTALTIFTLQLALNFAWSPVFFGMKSPLTGLVVIILMWFAILATILLFHRISQPAAYMLVPYLVWVSFAVYLNSSIYFLND